MLLSFQKEINILSSVNVKAIRVAMLAGFFCSSQQIHFKYKGTMMKLKQCLFLLELNVMAELL